MTALRARVMKVGILVAAFGALYYLALLNHEERDRIRASTVELTPNCKAKLEDFGLAAGERFRSARGYSEEDVRAIQRGCNLVDDLQGHLA